MSQSIKIALAQYPVGDFESLKAWEAHTAGWVKEGASYGASLLVFPEYGAMELASIFPERIRTDLHAQIEAMAGYLDPFLSVFENLAKKYQVVIVLPSFPVKTSGGFVNRAYVVSPKTGVAGYQDKLWMTRFENEVWYISSGEPRLSLFEADWGAFGLQICYDIEFPLGAHAQSNAGANLIIAPSCTDGPHGASRVHISARCRALENQCFTVVSQTVGNALWSPAVDVNYGYAAVYAPPDIGFPASGIISRRKSQNAGWLQATLEMEKIERVRKEGQVYNFSDNKKMQIFYLHHLVDVNNFPV